MTEQWVPTDLAHSTGYQQIDGQQSLVGNEIQFRFSREEYDSRVAKTRETMERRGLEMIVVTDPSNMAWLTGYDGWSFYVHQCVLLGLEGEPLWFGRDQDSPGARRTTWLSDANIIPYEDFYVQSTERHPMDRLSVIIAERGWSNSRIGVEMDNYYFTAACYRSLVTHLPTASIEDSTGLVNWQRAIKSEREIEYIRRAARIVEHMHQRIFELIEPGMPKNELVAEIFNAAIRGVDGFGGDYAAIVPLTPSGADAAAAHLTWDERPFKTDEGTFFEIAGCYRRYHCPQSRTVYLGKPPKHFLDAEKAVLEGIEAALEAARPGNTCEQVELAWRHTIARHGIEKESRCGYPIGLSYPPDWGERTMSLRPGDKTELQAGMTFHFIPAIWKDDWGLEITESFLVTDGAAEPFCNTPRRLFVKE